MKVQVLAEDAADIGRAVREVVAGVGVALSLRTPYGSDHAASIRVDEAAEQILWVRMRDVALPSRESDRAMVLPARPMLREQSEPMLPIGRDVDHAFIAPTAHPGYPAGCEGANCVATFGHDPRVTAVEREDELPGPGVAADPTIPEVEAEEVRIRLRRLARGESLRLTSRECTARFAKPVQESRSGDSGFPRNRVGAEALSVECQDPLDMSEGMHEQTFASVQDGLASGRPGWRKR
jgi:hypothetical protein